MTSASCSPRGQRTTCTGGRNLADTIARLQAFAAAGADVLYAPGLTELADIRQLVASVNRPVNVLAVPGCPPVATTRQIAPPT